MPTRNRYRQDPYWTTKRLTPAQIQIHDISFVEKASRREPRLELNEVLSSLLIPEDGFGRSEKLQQYWTRNLNAIRDLGCSSRIEEQKLLDTRREYEWMSEVRLDEEDKHIDCRWIHISSRFPEYLKGVLVGMSDWLVDGHEKVNAVRELERCTSDQERFSKHGKYFAPFWAPLAHSGRNAKTPLTEPMMISIPFFDWSVHPSKDVPDLRFQVDERERHHFTQGAMHPLRSLLQYYYRLEDTSERELNQVFAKHRPWYNDRDIDLKVRRWYGHYPASMIVDELWILIIDEKHIVSFSSNQTWKSRWPPLQLSSRIAELSFRSMRDAFHADNDEVRYTSMFQAIACLHGAVGLLHRSFWTDQPLPCTERYGGYLSHLQYRIYRSPSTRLVMDLLQTQDELNICHQITQKQLKMMAELKTYLLQHSPSTNRTSQLSSPSRNYSWGGISPVPIISHDDRTVQPHNLITTQDDMMYSNNIDRSGGTVSVVSVALSSIRDIETKLQREQDDISELRNNSNELITRTIQLVNIRMEDHGQAVLVFTVVTVIFLPLSFMSSFFGMNTTGIRDTQYGQWVFWASGLSLTVTVVILSMVLAFYGGRIHETLSDVKAGYVPHSDMWLGKIPFMKRVEGFRNAKLRFRSSIKRNTVIGSSSNDDIDIH